MSFETRWCMVYVSWIVRSSCVVITWS